MAQAKISQLVLTGDAVKETGGYLFTVFILRVTWECTTERGETCQVPVQVERRYKEFYQLYYELDKYPSVYYADFPRRVLWGSTSRPVVDYRKGVLASWLQRVADDAGACQDPALLRWLEVSRVKQIAEMRVHEQRQARAAAEEASRAARAVAAEQTSAAAVAGAEAAGAGAADHQPAAEAGVDAADQVAEAASAVVAEAGAADQVADTAAAGAEQVAAAEAAAVERVAEEAGPAEADAGAAVEAAEEVADQQSEAEAVEAGAEQAAAVEQAAAAAEAGAAEESAEDAADEVTDLQPEAVEQVGAEQAAAAEQVAAGSEQVTAGTQQVTAAVQQMAAGAEQVAAAAQQMAAGADVDATAELMAAAAELVAAAAEQVAAAAEQVAAGAEQLAAAEQVAAGAGAEQAAEPPEDAERVAEAVPAAEAYQHHEADLPVFASRVLPDQRQPADKDELERMLRERVHSDGCEINELGVREAVGAAVSSGALNLDYAEDVYYDTVGDKMHNLRESQQVRHWECLYKEKAERVAAEKGYTDVRALMVLLSSCADNGEPTAEHVRDACALYEGQAPQEVRQQLEKDIAEAAERLKEEEGLHGTERMRFLLASCAGTGPLTESHIRTARELYQEVS
eukprot:TRINITY_DN169_c0_g1_i1.p1 TRINITY_DN169_c0_g1~~TRINITY_DN169_c0_g1_i1.p1  ORF type:complete len:626 (+),score=214.74 TRINITY_DN169_c0_g1_i1:82-1959(+)